MDVKGWVILILLIIIAFLSQCEYERVKEVEVVNTLRDTVVVQVDKIKVIKQKDKEIVTRYINRIDTIIAEAPDTCKPIIIEAKQLCDSVIASKDSVIIVQDTLISTLQRLDKANDKQINDLKRQRKIARLVSIIGISIIFFKGLFTLI
jgi:predicted RecB family endonuclease